MTMTATNPEDTITGTTGDFAEMWGVEYTHAAGFIAVLKTKGIVKDVGTRPAKSGKGKPSNVFSVPKSFTTEM